MTNTIDISGLDKADVLRVFYNASQPLGLGFLHFIPGDITTEQAQEVVEVYEANGGLYFDYLQGRVMKSNLEGDDFDPWGFDRDNGQGAAAQAIATLRG